MLYSDFKFQQMVLIYSWCIVIKLKNHPNLYIHTKISDGQTMFYETLKYWCPGHREPGDCSVHHVFLKAYNL